MKRTILILIGIIGLALTLFPSILVFSGTITLQTHRNLMFLGTAIWLTSAPFWLGRNSEAEKG